jgi:hypothetical protein
MGHKIALVTAVEKYSHKTIPSVDYAEADAKGFASAIALHGYQAYELAPSSRATKSSIESNVRRHLKRLKAEDEFLFYYAGHGFSKNGQNYITAHDTDLNDLEGTSVRLQWIFDLIDESACERVALFLDSCESGITKLVKRRGLYAGMSETELDEFFRKAEYRVCFSACKTSESSYSAAALKHGIWTYHIIEALEGNAPGALEEKHRLTARSLQDYLSKEVPLTLRKAHSTPEVQTPWKYGGESRNFQIADLAEILKQRNAINPGYQQLKKTLLRDAKSIDIRSLSGFRKGHHVPDYVSSSTQNFVLSTSKAEIDEEMNEVFASIRENLKYKRRELTSEAGRIITPDFEYAVYATQNEDDPSEALIIQELTNVKPTVVQKPEFNEVFDGRFSEIVFQFDVEVDVEKLIDELEGLEREDVKLEYDSNTEWCELSIKGLELTVRMEPSELKVVSQRRKSPKELIEAFFEVQKMIAGTVVAPALKA